MRLNVFYPLFRHGYPTKKGRCVKTKMPIQSSTVGAGFACPKTQSKLFSGERTSPLRTKRQYYSHFDTTPFLGVHQYDGSKLIKKISDAELH